MKKNMYVLKVENLKFWLLWFAKVNILSKNYILIKNYIAVFEMFFAVDKKKRCWWVEGLYTYAT